MHKKKGSLSLSINAIVVLILAITMLGLGLGFIRGMFGKVSTLVDEQLEAEPAPVTPTINNPLTLSRDSIIGEKGKSRVVKVAVYCDISPTCSSTVTVSCNKVATKDIVSVTPPSFPTITQHNTAESVILLNMDGTNIGTTVCQVSAAAAQISSVAKTVSFVLTNK